MSQEETAHIDTAAFLRFNEDMAALRKAVKHVQDSIYSTTNYPTDPREKIIVVNTMNNVFDRIQDVVEQDLADRARALRSDVRKE